MEKYQQTLDTDDTYFVDDTPANVRAAIDFGWNASLVNLLNENIMQKVSANEISDEELKLISKNKDSICCLV